MLLTWYFGWIVSGAMKPLEPRGRVAQCCLLLQDVDVQLNLAHALTPSIFAAFAPILLSPLVLEKLLTQDGCYGEWIRLPHFL